ncbi:MAG: hypothetical protein ABIU30_22185 [Ferruginibacter sp.]
MRPYSLLLLAALLSAFNGCSQTGTKKSQDQQTQLIKVGGGCEGCEAIYESPVPFDRLNNIDTLPDFNESGPKISISGTIYQRDGRTPAKDVVLYIYHTDQKGNYSTRGHETGWGKRHGYIRGWIKTDENGYYQFYTLVPASYPNSQNPKHIHPVIKEPRKTEYYIDEFLFDDDPYLLKKEREKRDPRGGNGILKPVLKDGMLHATRNITLGLNVPGYPKKK